MPQTPEGAAPVGEQPTASEPEVSLVLETYNYGEGSTLDRLRRALCAAADMAARHGGVEVLLADSVGDPPVHSLLAGEFPDVRRVDAPGLDYDDAKLRAVSVARGRYVLFLDGDCLPARPGWLEAHLDALCRPGVVATSGFTGYAGGFLASLRTVLDFGYLLPRRERPLASYVSNNAGFRRELLSEVPTPQGPVRCRSYAHAQLMRRRGTPVWMVPEALVEHEREPFLPYRFHEGYEAIAVYWADPALRAAPLLRTGPLFAVLLYGRNVLLDWYRVLIGRRDVGLSRWQAGAALPLFPLARLVDFIGMLRAVTRRRPPTAGTPYVPGEDFGDLRRARRPAFGSASPGVG